MDAPVRIEPYDPSWPIRFEIERALIAGAIAPWLIGPIEHIGSTAVPGLAAKPVIDIMAGVESLEASRPAIEPLKALSYCYAPYRANEKHWFCKPSPEMRTHHLHLVPAGSAMWEEHIAFRDILRANAGVASEYAELKRRLAEIYRNDRDGYTDAKAPFIARILRERG